MSVPRDRFGFYGRTRPEKIPVLASVPEPAVKDGTATLRLYEPIDSYGDFWGVSALEFSDALASLPDDVTQIDLHINCPGGEVFEGIAILNQLRQHPARVTAIVDGLAASAASFIAAGVDECVMSPNTSLMIHSAWGLCIGYAEDMRKLADLLDHLSGNIATIYAGKAGGTRAEWLDLMLAETWFSPEEAVEAGLADSVGGAVGSPENRFDLSKFKYAGRAAAPAPAVAPATPPAASGMSERERRLKARQLAARAAA